jgi:hypothetical protein
MMPRHLTKIIIAALAALALAPLVYLAAVQRGEAQDTLRHGAAAPADTIPEAINRYVENIAFGAGERLTFDIGYGFINAGSATMEVAKLIDYRGRPAYQIVTTAQSNKFFSSFYPVSDRAESIVDAIGLFSWHFEKVLREGKYRAERACDFDQIGRTAIYKNDTIPVPPYVQDALSALYYIRTQPLEVGRSLFVDNFTDGKNYPLEVKIHRKEKIATKAGQFDCLVVEPLLQTSGIFKHEGKLTVWLTDDRLRLPVMMKSKVVVGSITAELVDYRLGRLEEF